MVDQKLTNHWLALLVVHTTFEPWIQINHYLLTNIIAHLWETELYLTLDHCKSSVHNEDLRTLKHEVILGMSYWLVIFSEIHVDSSPFYTIKTYDDCYLMTYTSPFSIW